MPTPQGSAAARRAGHGQNISTSLAARFARALDAAATELIAENPRLDIQAAIREVLQSDEDLAEMYRKLILGYSGLVSAQKESYREHLHAGFAEGASTRGVLRFLDRI